MTWNLYKPEELVLRAPLAPVRHDCPDCQEERGKSCKLRFLYSVHRQWGCVVTRHDVYRCRHGHGRYVSTNGWEVEATSADII